MRKFIAGVIVTLIVIAGGLYLYVSRGSFPIGADNAPSKMERHLANMAMDEYIDRHAPQQPNPFEPTSANLIEGATEYEQHCALCHGGAAARTSPLGKRFNPHAPQLLNQIPDDEDWHLFFAVKHGIRLTGMPAWEGTLSDDQMWKVIAFIKHSDKLPPDVQTAWQQAAFQQHKH